VQHSIRDGTEWKNRNIRTDDYEETMGPHKKLKAVACGTMQNSIETGVTTENLLK